MRKNLSGSQNIDLLKNHFFFVKKVKTEKLIIIFEMISLPWIVIKNIARHLKEFSDEKIYYSYLYGNWKYILSSKTLERGSSEILFALRSDQNY